MLQKICNVVAIVHIVLVGSIKLVIVVVIIVFITINPVFTTIGDKPTMIQERMLLVHIVWRRIEVRVGLHVACFLCLTLYLT